MTIQTIELPGGKLTYYPEFLATEQADRLLDQLAAGVAWRQDRIRLFGKEHPIPRLQAFQGEPGLSYRYSNLCLQSSPWHPALPPLLDRLAQLCGQRFNCVLLNLYRDGQDSMGWHSDDESELGANPRIASLSLGASRRFLLRHRKHTELDKQELLLEHGSLLLMEGALQHNWQHSLPRSRRVGQCRVNLTFRHILPSTTE
ncbi:alpha-ketoglutarate-dependent dioxygenase AlkB [Marinobacterium sp. CAU 1594]|nr:alpha-ketoglutarate-dependent dioxygenase AlkB [Marinobacterium arenosum]